MMIINSDFICMHWSGNVVNFISEDFKMLHVRRNLLSLLGNFIITLSIVSVGHLE